MIQVQSSNVPVFQPTVITDIHFKPGWRQPSNTGNTGGGSAQPHGGFLFLPIDPSKLGAGVVNSTVGLQQLLVAITPASSFDNYYFYNDLGANAAASKFIVQIAFTFPTQAEIDACQGFEWELEQAINGNVWNMGWQLLLKPGPGEQVGFRLFDYVNQKWVAQKIAFDPAIIVPGNTITVLAEHFRDCSSQTHVALSVNGVRSTVGVTQPMKPNRWPGANYLHAAFQLDATQQFIPYAVIINSYDAAYV